MTTRDIFHWHSAARLFAELDEVFRRDARALDVFTEICATNTSDALAQLIRILGTGQSFCLYEKEPPDGFTAPKTGEFLTLTGGTSGRPKAVRRTQASWVASFDVNAHLFRLTSDDTIAVFGRLSHSLALYGLLEGLHLGLDVQVLAELSPGKQHAALLAKKTTVLYATPTQLRLLARGQVAPLVDVRLILCGGGLLDGATEKQLSVLCPRADLRVFYGAAETSFIALSDNNTPQGSVGRAYPGVTFELRGPDGEIWVQSPYLFEGYASDESREAKCNDGFVSIGELGQRDSRGNLTIKGRKSRIVQIADQNVHLEEVEKVLIELPEIPTCAVIAQPDMSRGQKLVAVLEGPTDTKLVTKVRQHCRYRLNALMTPKSVFFIAELPLLPSGKTDLISLAKWVEHQT